uniref:NodB homology domain-containing protein n=1 Tax=Chromera velia CCMP2878 TaxID=1169474 RepID=A0A0G4H6W4_9ALVE|eukprot:Cvel_24941.t1-p1 / transcript=Cvel_24941.t1 / gene=Cvel_24941 / organism=Chromera_velia_CCMP2878 / gene_product=Chitooligosaccharide deacetylase, putative / transcript_product=Chitooligosaccharide deacetylase, putative / location=Cvel_scaffold2760:705-1515(-) / protein_length=221 / sequence_SO=supercontig / SO=protein_coding / is_pseudo=false
MTTPGQDAEERPKEKAGRKERWTVFGWQIANCCGSRQLGRISKVVPFLPHKRCVYHYSIPSSLWARYEQTSLKPPIALTIDDAPGRHDSVNNALLDLFKDHNVRATFFIISGHVKDHEEVCRRMVREGHELGNHSTEDRAVADLSEGEFEARLTECENILDSLRETAGGQREEGNDGLNRKKWFRPPCAALSWKMCSVLEKKGCVLFSINVEETGAKEAFP